MNADTGAPDPDQICGVLGVSRETAERLQTYGALLARWGRKINLVSRTTLDDIWERHILDSAQLADLAPATKIWADLGAGAGLPGLVVAILNRERNPACRHVLIDSDARKAAFLREAVRALELDVTVIAGRIEHIKPQMADVVSARALAPLPRLLELAERHLAPGGLCLFPKGRAADQELISAGAAWRMRVTRSPSRTSEDSGILRIEELSRAPAADP